MFMGQYNCKLDSKGRLTMPSKFREQLTKTFIITRGLDHNINLYPMEVWEEKMKSLQNLKETNTNQRKYARFILSAAVEVECDAQGRINLPKSLIDYTQIEKDAIVTGINSRIEIWSKENWDKTMESDLENMADIANELDF